LASWEGSSPGAFGFAQGGDGFLGAAGEDAEAGPEGMEADPIVLVFFGVEELLRGGPGEDLLVEGYGALAELGQVHRRLQERQHHFLGTRGKCSPFAKPADVARQPFEGAQERDLCPFQVARFAARAGKADFRGTEARRELQHPAELVLRAIEIAELVEIDLAERPPRQHLGFAALLGGPPQDADRFLRIGLPQLERGASDVVENAHAPRVDSTFRLHRPPRSIYNTTCASQP